MASTSSSRYPSDVDKHILSRQTGLSRSQVSNWFINARVRLWKPMVEEMYVEETKEQDNQSSEGTAEHEDNNNNNSGRPSQLLHSVQNPNPSVSEDDDQKPPLGRHLHILSDSLSSVVDSGTPRPGGREHRGWHQPRPEDFGAVNLDFSSYNHQNTGGSGGVSLTLGLQQHAGVAMSLSFSQASSTQQQSIFFSRDQLEDCQPVQFSIIEGEEAQNLPYRNLMGVQLLHDLAG